MSYYLAIIAVAFVLSVAALSIRDAWRWTGALDRLIERRRARFRAIREQA